MTVEKKAGRRATWGKIWYYGIPVFAGFVWKLFSNETAWSQSMTE